MTQSGRSQNTGNLESDMEDDAVERARVNLWAKNRFRHGDTTLIVACLIRPEDTRPLRVPWWRGKEVYLIGVEENGNFFLRHCDGSVRYWDHRKQQDEVIAKSVNDFVGALEKADIRL